MLEDDYDDEAEKKTGEEDEEDDEDEDEDEEEEMDEIDLFQRSDVDEEEEIVTAAPPPPPRLSFSPPSPLWSHLSVWSSASSGIFSILTVAWAAPAANDVHLWSPFSHARIHQTDTTFPPFI